MTIDEAIRNNTAPSDFETFKKFFDLMGIEYEIPVDNLIYLSGFEVEGSQLIVVKFYEDGKFQKFCPYPEEGLTELKDLREVNKVLISECDRLIKEKGELLSKVSGGDVLRICQLEEQLEKAKELLKAAVEDFQTIDKLLIDTMDSSCAMFNHMANNCPNCPMNALDTEGKCKWRYTDEALKLIGDELSGVQIL